MGNNNTTNNDGWLTEKPVFTTDCILLTAVFINKEWEYQSFLKKWALGENEKGEKAWYISVCDLKDGEEWGDIADLQADRYKIVEFPG